MNKNKISQLLQRFFDGHKMGREPYFDADEIDELLDSLEMSADYTYYDEILRLGLKLHPNNIELKIKQCRSFLYYEEYEKALKYVNSISQSHTEELDLLRLECYCMNNDYPSVRALTLELIQEERRYLKNIFPYISSTLNELGMYDEAFDFIKLGLSIYPDDIYLKDEECYTLEMKGNIQDAISICNEMIDEDPYSFDYWLNMGHLYSLNEQFDKAIDAFDFAMTCNSSRVDEVSLMKGYCYYMNENYAEAIKLYESLDVKDPLLNEHVKPVLAECYLYLQEYRKTYELLLEYYETYNKFNDADNYLHFFFCCMELNKESEGMEMLYTGIKAFPENIRLMSVMIIVLLKKNEYKKAKDIMKLMLKVVNNNDSDENHAIGDIPNIDPLNFTAKDVKSAFKSFNKILEMYPDVSFAEMIATLFYYNKKEFPASQFDSDKIPLIVSNISDKKEYLKNLKQNINPNTQDTRQLVSLYLNNKDHNN